MKHFIFRNTINGKIYIDLDAVNLTEARSKLLEIGLDLNDWVLVESD